MGYTNTFRGCFTITPPLEGAPKALLKGLCNTRRMAREMDPIYGIEGEYYVGDEEAQEGRLLDYAWDRPPRTQPGYWCQWMLSDDGAKLQWSGAEKFYCYTEWLRYFITRVFPQGTVLNGEVRYEGEELGDEGVIQITDNRIRVVVDGEQPELRMENTEIICLQFASAAPHIVQSLRHYRKHHDMILGLPLKADYYISCIMDLADKLDGTLPLREWIIGPNGDVTSAVYFSVLLNPELSDQDVTSTLSAYNKFCGIEELRRLPEASMVRKFCKTLPGLIPTRHRSPWRGSSADIPNSWYTLSWSRSYLEELIKISENFFWLC
ncbi:hypothetical protein KC19_4G132000 [Ceratodon purpureus]|uniref:Uncharacterized protein n=1 Tax=Ceratodon purpureus TaxID=3225 RepID=A0A8T0IAR4_CERPU|nr:hypothetical protein KC19_4G132000 [Ceratodon purpureus]